MSDSRFDQFELTTACPRCGHKTKKSIGWLKRHPRFTCRCGNVTFASEELVRDFEEASRKLDQFGRNIRR